MRVLCNYTYKNNGSHENFSITLEKMGDLKDGQVDTTIDELFALSKAAVQRQIDGDLEFPPKDEITIPKPKNNNNGNGKPQIKDPDSQISPKQKSLIIRLAKQKGEFIKDVDRLTKQAASNIIEELMSVGV